MRCFQLFEPLHQTVVGGIRNLRLVQNVVQILVVPQFVAQLFGLVFSGYSLGHGTLERTFIGMRIILYRMEFSRRG